MGHALATVKFATFAIAFALATSAGVTSSSAGPTCKCRYFGKFYALGQSICIRGRVATCALVLNNSSWNFSDRDCQPVADTGKRQSVAIAPRQSRQPHRQ